MNEIVQTIADAMNNSLGAPLTVLLLALIPIAEARFAILFGLRMGLTPIEAFGWAFLGSSLIAPILLLVFIPIINALSRTKLFSKLGRFLYDKFEKKSHSIADPKENEEADSSDTSKKKKFRITKKDLKKMGGTALFVAVPIPLTGVWTGSAVASIAKIGFVKGLIGVVVGNAVACTIITLICSFFSEQVLNWIMLAFLIIAVVVVFSLIIKFLLYKPDKNKTVSQSSEETPSDKNNNSEG